MGFNPSMLLSLVDNDYMPKVRGIFYSSNSLNLWVEGGIYSVVVALNFQAEKRKNRKMRVR